MKATLNIPSDLSEIRLEQYQKLIKVKNPTDLFLVTTLCDLPLEFVREIKKDSVDEITKHLTDLLNSETPFVPKFKIGKTEYGFIPNLQEITMGEYVDLETFSQKEELDRVMAVLYRPIKSKFQDKYTIEKYKGVDNYLMKLMPLNVFLGALVFFYDLGKELLNVTQSSLMEKAEGTLLKNGDGTDPFITWQMKIFKN